MITYPFLFLLSMTCDTTKLAFQASGCCGNNAAPFDASTADISIADYATSENSKLFQNILPDVSTRLREPTTIATVPPVALFLSWAESSTIW